GNPHGGLRGAAYSACTAGAASRRGRPEPPTLSKETIMQARTVLSSLVLAATFAGSAFAETPNAVPEAAFTASKSRAEVMAELQAYKQAGVNPWSTTYNPLRS